MATIQIPEDPIARLIANLPGYALESRRADIAEQEAEDLKVHREAIVGAEEQEAEDLNAYRLSEQARLREQEINLVAYRKNSLELEEHKEMMDLVEGLVPSQRLAVVTHMFAQNPDYMPNGQSYIDELTIQVGNIESDRTNFARVNSLIQNGDLSGAAEAIKSIQNPDFVTTASNYLNTARKTQWEVSRPELSREQQVAKMKLDLISQRLQLELDAREYNKFGLLIDPVGAQAQSIAELRGKYKTAYAEFEALLTGTPVTPPGVVVPPPGVVVPPPGGVVPPPGGVVTPGAVVTPPVITPTRQYSFMVTSGKGFGFLGDYSIDIIGPAGNSIEVEAAKADRIIKKGKRVDRDNYLGRMKNLFGVDEAEAIKLLSKAYASRKGEVGELQGGAISVRSAPVVVGSGLSPEDEEALNAVLQEHPEE